jgi:hypothetical protein
MKRREVDWLKLEVEIQGVLRRVKNCQEDNLLAALHCIDEIVAFHTRRGNMFDISEFRRDYENRYPLIFDRKW